jgi:hypothetical protein
VIDRVPVHARRLDDISEIEHLNFLKIDVQGGRTRGVSRREIQAVGDGGDPDRDLLRAPVKDQPTLDDIDLELRGQGFLPHCFPAIKLWPIAPCVDPRQPFNQLLEADSVYVRDFTDPDSLSDEQLKHLALIAHYCYRSFDLALRCVMLLQQRQAVAARTGQRYLEILETGWWSVISFSHNIIGDVLGYRQLSQMMVMRITPSVEPQATNTEDESSTRTRRRPRCTGLLVSRSALVKPSRGFR